MRSVPSHAKGIRPAVRNVTADAVRRSGLPVGTALAMIRKDIQELRRQALRPHPEAADFEHRLHEIAAQIDALQSSAPSSVGAGRSMEEFLAELKALLAQNESRLAALQHQVATSAAVAISGPAETIRRDVASLKEIQVSVDRRTQDTFEAVYGTIERIVDRLAAIEGELRDRPAAALERRAGPAVLPPSGREVPALVPAEGAKMTAMLRQPALPDLVPDAPVRSAAVQAAPRAGLRRTSQVAARLAAAARQAIQTLSGPAPAGIRRGILTQRGKLAVLGVGAVLLMLFAITFALDSYRQTPAVVSDSLPPDTEERAAIDPEKSDEETARAAEPSPSPNQMVRQESDRGHAFNAPASAFLADTNPLPDGVMSRPAAGPLEVAAAAMPADGKPDADASALMRNAVFPAPVGNDPWSPPPASGADLTATPLPPEIGSKALIDAASAGDPGASHEIAIRFAQGRVGGAPNFEMAAAWLDRAARAGIAPAQFRLGGLYEKGLGVRKDPAEARRLYMAAAAKGHAKAMHNLAVLYAAGTADGAPDYAAAAGWFRKAAAYGTVDSQYNLGILYARGSGVERDFVESYKWFTLAIKGGDKDAVHKRDEVARALDAKQLESARQAADAFVAKRQPDEATATRAPAGGWDEIAAATTKSKPLPRQERSPGR
jgi:localization factor PodJL